MRNSSAKIWLIVILFLAAFIVGSSFYLKKSNKPASTAVSSQPALRAEQVPAVEKTEKMGVDYANLIVRTGIQQIIQGKLTAKDENSWTLEKDGQTLTLEGENSPQIRYFKLTGKSNVEIKAKDIKVGDEVSISRLTNWQSAKSTITGVTILSAE